MPLATSLPYTLLSLPRYAKILGIPPLHFMGGTGDALPPHIFPEGTCSSIWHKYSWQSSDHVSHQELADVILTAEQEIANYLGYWPAPTWVIEEPHMYSRPYVREAYGIGGLNVRSQPKAVKADYGRFIAAGQRSVIYIGTPTVQAAPPDAVVFSDEDSDGFDETAIITFTIPAGLLTTVTDVNHVKIYHTGKNGEPDWEIRPAVFKDITAGTITIQVESWILFSQELYETFPTVGNDPVIPIDATDIDSYITDVDLYYEVVSTTDKSVTFYWENGSGTGVASGYCSCSFCGGTGCPQCNYTTQDGCINARNPMLGLLVPIPASYSEENSRWQSTSYTVCRDPDIVRLWYYAGEIDQRYYKGYTHDPLSDLFAQCIAFLATARLERPPCACNNVVALFESLREDLALSGEGSYNFPFAQLDNSFGTRRGELLVWKRLVRFVQNKISFAVI